MKKIIKHILIILGFVVFILGLIQGKSNAATLSISTSKSSVSPGGTFNVTVSVSGGAGSVNISVSNGTGSTSQFIDNSSYSFNCTAGTSGNISISASGTIADYTTELDESKSASKSVGIVIPTPSTPTPKPVVVKSSDANLASITVEGYSLEQEFSKSNTEYSLTVPNEVTVLNISAKVNNSKAKYSITEIPELQVGNNVYKITVTAEDGTKKAYNITVNRERAKLTLSALSVHSVDSQDIITELLLSPIFSSNVYTYKLEDLSHTIKSLKIDAISNLEGAIIEMNGNDELTTGENLITITAIFKEEGKEDEIIKYEIIVNKKAEPIPPTKLQKIQNWFNSLGNNIFGWYTINQAKFNASLLLASSSTLLGLTIYFIIDYKKYKILTKKIAELTEMNIKNVNLEKEETTKVKTGGKHSE